MIVVRVELHSAITGRVTELARMHLANQIVRTTENHHFGDYAVKTFIGRNAKSLDKLRVQREGVVDNYPRLRLHVWNLVTRALCGLGYTK